MVFAGQDAWRKHPMLTNCYKRPFPGFGIALGLFAGYCVLDGTIKFATGRVRSRRVQAGCNTFPVSLSHQSQGNTVPGSYLALTTVVVVVIVWKGLSWEDDLRFLLAGCNSFGCVRTQASPERAPAGQPRLRRGTALLLLNVLFWLEFSPSAIEHYES